MIKKTGLPLAPLVSMHYINKFAYSFLCVIMDSVYLNPENPAYLAGVNAVYRESKKINPQITVKDVEAYLDKQNTHSIHKPVKRKFDRNRVRAVGLDSDWQLDLICLPSIKKYNKGYGYILACVDVLSKYGWAVPIRDKKPESVRDGFKRILESSNRKPWCVMTDRGWEFRGRAFQAFLKDRDIQYFTANSPDVKAPNVERYIRTLKTRLWKHFTLKKTFNFLAILPKLVSALNNAVCRVTKHAPADVTHENELEVKEILYGANPNAPAVKFKYAVGDRVRITKEKHKLAKGYVGNFTEEVFIVKQRLARHPPVYRLTDEKGEDVTGIFYHQELTRAPAPVPPYIRRRPTRKAKNGRTV
ncbi:MAG: transposase family protein [Gammaproteobacteria bacterium]|nr:transposase family protein [Gammaproteobacteria bacterium]